MFRDNTAQLRAFWPSWHWRRRAFVAQASSAVSIRSDGIFMLKGPVCNIVCHHRANNTVGAETEQPGWFLTRHARPIQRPRFIGLKLRTFLTKSYWCDSVPHFRSFKSRFGSQSPAKNFLPRIGRPHIRPGKPHCSERIPSHGIFPFNVVQKGELFQYLQLNERLGPARPEFFSLRRA